MPIIIDEIVISVEVTSKLAEGAGAAAAGADSDVIIEQCVERVLEKLREREEPRP